MVEVLCAVLPGQALTRENVGDSLTTPLTAAAGSGDDQQQANANAPDGGDDDAQGHGGAQNDADMPIGAPRQREGA